MKFVVRNISQLRCCNLRKRHNHQELQGAKILFLLKSSMFGNQARAPKETRVPNGAQTGAAAPLKNIQADNDFQGNDVKLPFRPPSGGPAMSAELGRIFRAVQSWDRQSKMLDEIL